MMDSSIAINNALDRERKRRQKVANAGVLKKNHV